MANVMGAGLDPITGGSHDVGFVCNQFLHCTEYVRTFYTPGKGKKSKFYPMQGLKSIPHPFTIEHQNSDPMLFFQTLDPSLLKSIIIQTYM